MSSGLQILIAVIAGSGIPLWFLQRFDKRNTDQHNQNLSVLELIHDDVQDLKDETRQVKSHLTDHLQWHLKGDAKREPKRRTG